MRLTFSFLGIFFILTGCAKVDSNGFVMSPPKTSTTVYNSSLSEDFDPYDINTINASMVPSQQQIKAAEQEQYQDKLSDMPVDTSYEW